jgi:23S rRNA pseudouridine1911/1915/1917 synthase
LAVPRLDAATRLDVYLVASGSTLTRSQAKNWIDAGRVRVNGLARKAGFLLVGGESIEILRPPPKPSVAEPEDLALRVLYEDADLLAIDKPSGMVVHPAPGAWQGTIVNALLHRGLVSRDASTERPGIVHRLDKETSGVLLVARHERAQLALSRAFRDRRIHKTYVAIVLGAPRSAVGSLEWPIGRHPHERQRMSIRSRSPREARTRYVVVERFHGLSVLRLEPETGRTHQIRVHLAAMGHPVLADALYGARKGRALPAHGAGHTFARHALHAAELALAHPITGVALHLVAPIPADMTELMRELRREATSEDRS